jgi:phosphatidylglycerol:prolipoprotein diacylglycerol transferase
MLGWMQLNWLHRRGASLLSGVRVPDAMMAMIFGVVLGGRLGYVLIYQRPMLWEVSSSFPFWGVLMVNKGGMAFHGALVGLLIAAWFIARGARTEDGGRASAFPFAHMLDLMAFVAPAGLMLGRIANFVNGELLGQIVASPGQAAPWWSVKFPQEIGSGHPVAYTPEQVARLDAVLDQFGRTTAGEGVAIERMMQEVQHGSGSAHAALLSDLATLVSARHPSQLYQAIAEGPILGLVLWIAWARPKRPGVIACVFLIAYGVLRVVIEQFFRLPDPGLAVQRIVGLSRGQWLSSAMVVAGGLGLVLIRVAARRHVGEGVRVGGWMSHPTP